MRGTQTARGKSGVGVKGDAAFGAGFSVGATRVDGAGRGIGGRGQGMLHGGEKPGWWDWASGSGGRWRKRGGTGTLEPGDPPS